MPVVNYHTVDGLLMGETDGAGARRDYLTDALGSVTATVDQTAAVRNTYRYTPYGIFAATTTPEAVSRFAWTGETGSLVTRGTYAEHYNRARFYGRTTGRWTSVDPLWPEESAYGYVDGNPTTFTDPSGRQGARYPGDPLTECARDWTDAWNRFWNNPPLTKLPPLPPLWGNYCGPQSAPPKGAIPPRPQDKTDACCEAHDNAWQKKGCTAVNQVKRVECKRDTDKLCDCMKNSPCSSFLECIAKGELYRIYCRMPFTTHSFPPRFFIPDNKPLLQKTWPPNKK